MSAMPTTAARRAAKAICEHPEYVVLTVDQIAGIIDRETKLLYAEEHLKATFREIDRLNKKLNETRAMIKYIENE